MRGVVSLSFCGANTPIKTGMANNNRGFVIKKFAKEMMLCVLKISFGLKEISHVCCCSGPYSSIFLFFFFLSFCLFDGFDG